MPRNPRVHYSHAIYHVMHQGNYKQNIFYEAADYLKFYSILEKVTCQYSCKIHVFCLMTNHVHLLIEVLHIPLRKIMQTIATTYSNYINKKHDRHGHLFRGRYLDKLVEDERYFLELFYYIHMNPLKAKIVQNLSAYPWSSYHCYAGNKKLHWLSTEAFKNLIINETGSDYCCESFMEHCNDHYSEPKFCELDGYGVLTIKAQVSNMLQTSKTLDLKSLSPMQIVEIVCEHIGISKHLITTNSKSDLVTMGRTLAAYYAHYHGRYKIKEIAHLLNCPVDTLSKTMHRQFASELKRAKLEMQMVSLEQKFVDSLMQKEKNIFAE